MAPDIPYTKGPHEVADGVWAYLQPDGGWGWSNAGLITGGGAGAGDPEAAAGGSMLVDTLFDLELTGEMLAALRGVTPAAERITTVVNTHANGDHCYGNALVPGAEIVASVACAQEQAELPPAALAAYVKAAPELGQLGAYLLDIFGRFHLGGIELVAPTRTFSGQLDLRVGDRLVELIEVGPAHTTGDVVVHIPDAGVVFTGDILFHGGHPIVWAGPVANWIAACDRLLALDDVHTVVPGHGPVTDLGALADLKDYFQRVVAHARESLAAGHTPLEAARHIDLGPHRQRSEPERLVANLNAAYRDLGADVPTDAATVMGLMAQLAS